MLGGVARFLLYVGLAACVGGVVTATLLLRDAIPSSKPESGDANKRCRRLWLVGLALVAFATVVRAWLQVDGLRDPADPFWPMALRVLVGTSWGKGFGLQLAGIGLSIAGARAGGSPRWRPGVFAKTGAICLVAAPAWQGHAAGADHFVPLVMLADAVHTASFAAWIGTLMGVWLVFLVDGSERSPAGSDAEALPLLIARFSPLAISCGVMLASTGAAAGLLHLTAVADLWSSGWGRLLVAKLAAVAALAAAGAYNWRIVTPRLRRGEGQAMLRRGIRRELLFATVTLIVTAILTGTGTPGSE